MVAVRGDTVPMEETERGGAGKAGVVGRWVHWRGPRAGRDGRPKK